MCAGGLLEIVYRRFQQVFNEIKTIAEVKNAIFVTI